ncbi:hypothetical protein A9K55_002893 [Cordyceps militaris]|uniref:Uncharacterized protein n=1 Tax=Cordyceps militaris TaxID=73501 RepID=A0A2H4S862_CORMI|nr:hypothetical protein A9K55_002893 [Cordyceps militaris]
MEDQSSPSRHHLGRSVSQPEPRPSPSIYHSRRFDGTNNNTLPLAPSPPLTLAESWVELSSQPSSSSLSSVDNEIVTTGLQVGSPFQQRRRRLHPAARSLPPQQQHTVIHAAGAGASSQDEDEEEESDSDEDRVMTSSAENIHSSEKEPSDGDDDDDSDDGDNATTLGHTSNPPVFQPHPNAFTHPPAGLLAQRSYSTSSAEHPHPHSSFRRSSYPHRHSRGQRGAAPPNFMSPSVREDNDAALRASLTTLLSCAAAARGLPKTKDETDAQRTTRTGVAPSNQPMELRFMPESELLAGEDKQHHRRRPSSGAVSPKSKRSESAGRSGGPRPPKKKRTVAAAEAEYALISPTLLSWVVSAGVVVLVSVVGFGAGYVIGREVGREEVREALAASIVGGGGVNDTTSAGSDVIRSSVGLRKLRWSAVGRSIVAQA